MMKREIRVRDGFSDRNSINPIPKDMQLLDFLPETRVAIYNAFKNIINYQIYSRRLDDKSLAKVIVENVFNDVYSKYKDTIESVLNDIFDVFKEGTYDEVLTIIEYVCNLLYEREERLLAEASNPYERMRHQDVRSTMNAIFEKEYIGYRFVNGSITRITNESEIESIKEACDSPFKDVNISLSKAVNYLSETGTKDYKNSIKESITAVEQLMNILLKKEGLVLSNSIEQFANKVKIDDDLKIAIKSLYKYTSNVNGIRHGNNKNNDKVTFEEAKLVLLICSATINYFITLKVE